MDEEKTSNARRINTLSFRRIGVRRNNRIFIAAKQVSEPVGFRMKSFYDAIIDNITTFYLKECLCGLSVF